MNQRVIDILKYKNLTPSKFADMIGVPRSTISHIISGRNNPSLELVTKITDKFPDIRIDWLIKGKGSMFRSQTSLFDDSDYDFKPDTKAQSKPIKTTKDETTSLITEKSKSEDDSEKNTTDNTEETDNIKEFTDKNIKVSAQQSKNVSKIILVFDDNTFELIFPSNNKS